MLEQLPPNAEVICSRPQTLETGFSICRLLNFWIFSIWNLEHLSPLMSWATLYLLSYWRCSNRRSCLVFTHEAWWGTFSILEILRHGSKTWVLSGYQFSHGRYFEWRYHLISKIFLCSYLLRVHNPDCIDLPLIKTRDSQSRAPSSSTYQVTPPSVLIKFWVYSVASHMCILPCDMYWCVRR